MLNLTQFTNLVTNGTRAAFMVAQSVRPNQSPVTQPFVALARASGAAETLANHVILQVDPTAELPDYKPDNVVIRDDNIGKAAQATAVRYSEAIGSNDRILGLLQLFEHWNTVVVPTQNANRAESIASKMTNPSDGPSHLNQLSEMLRLYHEARYSPDSTLPTFKGSPPWVNRLHADHEDIKQMVRQILERLP